MQHISAMAAMFDNVVSRDQILKDRVIEYVGLRTGISLDNKQVIIGQTIAIIQHITFAERSVLEESLDKVGLVDYLNSNAHDFSLKDVMIR